MAIQEYYCFSGVEVYYFLLVSSDNCLLPYTLFYLKCWLLISVTHSWLFLYLIEKEEKKANKQKRHEILWKRGIR